MKKIEEYDGVEYTLATITGGTAKEVSLSGEDGNPLPDKEFNLRVVASSLEAGGHKEPMKIAASLPIFFGGVYGRFLHAALLVNGLRTEKKESTSGEDQADSSPASESTGSLPTDDSPVLSDGDIAT